MKVSHSFFVLGLSLASLALTACGNKSGEAAKVMSGLFTKSETSNLQLRELVHERTYSARKVAEGQAWLTKFRLEAGQGVSPMVTDDPELTCTGTNPGSTGSFDISCTNSSADDTFTCGSTEYTWHSGSTFRVYGSMTSNIFSVNMSMTGHISGGKFDANTALSCNFGFTFDLTKLQEGNAEAYSADCSNTNLSCTLGSDTIGCEDLLKATNDHDNQCTN